ARAPCRRALGERARVARRDPGRSGAAQRRRGLADTGDLVMNHAETLVLAGESKTLDPGQRLGDFLITRVVGQGGFGVVYEAEDLTLQRRVAIKEYMPAQLAARSDGVVHPVSSRYAKTFELGRRGFLAEARLLAQF